MATKAKNNSKKVAVKKPDLYIAIGYDGFDWVTEGRTSRDEAVAELDYNYTTNATYVIEISDLKKPEESARTITVTV